MIAATLATTKLGDNQHKEHAITIDEAATMMSVSSANIKVAKEVLDKGAPAVQTAVRRGFKRLGAVKKLLDLPKEDQEKELKKPPEPPKKGGQVKTPKAPKAPEANQRMMDLDQAKAKWQAFNHMQRRAFVTAFKDDLRKLLDEITEQEAMNSRVAAE
jgi:hypothetical protein